MEPDLAVLCLEVIKGLADDIELVDLGGDLCLILVPLVAHEREFLGEEVVLLSYGVERVVDARSLGRRTGLQGPVLWRRRRMSHGCVGKANTCED